MSTKTVSRTPRITALGRRRAERVRSFAELYLRHSKDRFAGQPFRLEPWQWQRIILPIYGTLDASGKRWYDRALIGLPRWNGKSEIAALMVVAHLVLDRVYSGEAYAVAASHRQARIVYDTVKQMFTRSPDLSRMVDAYKSELMMRETGCVFRALPHDADTAQGYHPSLAVIDELHVHHSRAMLDAMLTGAVGREEPLTVVITTAGAQRSGVWWDVLQEWREDPRAYVYWVGATDHDDPVDRRVWRKANPASWVTMERLETLYRTLPAATFERYHLNRAPQRAAGAAIRADQWQACGGRPEINPEQPCVIGVDASLRRDHTAVVLDQYRDGLHHVLAFTFTPEADELMGAVDHDAVGALLRELAATYRVTRVVCDRAYFVRTMRELLTEGLPIEEFAQTNQNMARASQRLYDAVSGGRIRHGGDAALTQHVLNAGIKETPFGWRLIKVDQTEHIDGAIALAMALDAAEAEAEAPVPGVLIG